MNIKNNGLLVLFCALLGLVVFNLHSPPATADEGGGTPGECLADCEAAVQAALEACFAGCDSKRAKCDQKCLKGTQSPSEPDAEIEECLAECSEDFAECREECQERFDESLEKCQEKCIGDDDQGEDED